MRGAHPDEPQLDREHPWPGLVAFNEDARNFFFGREEEEGELMRRIRREVATLLFGESGLGKTSLLQAGLAPRLREQGLVPLLMRLSYGPDAISPAAQLRCQFEEGIAAASPGPRPLGDDETLWEYLHRRDLSPRLSGAESPIPVLLIDQFEEAFSLGLGRDGARAGTQQLLSELVDLIENRCPDAVKARLEQDPSLIDQFDFERSDYRIVIVIREDYLSRLESLRGRAPSLGLNGFRLLRMNGDQALEAVVQPAGGLIEPEVAEEVIRYIARPRPDDPFGTAGADGQPALADLDVDPPMLSLFCSELNARRIKAEQDQITSDLLNLNKDRILRDFYENAFNSLPRRVRSFVEDELVTDSGLRASMVLEQAEKRVGRRGRDALSELVRRRLLHIEERSDMPRIELIHDRLIPFVLDSRGRRRKRRLRAAIAGGLILVATFFFVNWWETRREIAEAELRADAIVERARACANSPNSQLCMSLTDVQDRALRNLPEADVDVVLLGLLQVANSRFAGGEVAASLSYLSKVKTLLEGRESYRLERARNYSSMAERERWLRRWNQAWAHYQMAHDSYLEQLPSLRDASGGTSDMDTLDATLDDLAVVDFQLATFDERQRAERLQDGLRLENERALRAERAAGAAPGDESAQRHLAFVLGSRSWAYVLLSRPDLALADAERAEQIAGPAGLANDEQLRWILTNRGDALLEQGHVAEAINVFETIAQRPGLPPNRYMCADVLEDMRVLRIMLPNLGSRIATVESHFQACTVEAFQKR
jgi:hypothetical protein